MGPGRKTQTKSARKKSQPSWTINCSVAARNLKQSDLFGVIFGCKHNTYKECLESQLFGLPAQHFSYVGKVRPGLKLFLFNYSDRRLHGIFEAVSPGQMAIKPNAWTEDGSQKTPFPAQVRMRIWKECSPLPEEKFKPIIADNYYEQSLFWFELDQLQTKNLMDLFSESSSQVTSRFNTCTSFSPTRTDKQKRGNGCETSALEARVSYLNQGVCAKNIDPERMFQKSNNDHSYASLVRSTTTSVPQKKWSALFEAVNGSDETVTVEEFDALASEKHLLHLDSSDRENYGNYDEVVSLSPNKEVISFFATKENASLPHSSSYESLPINGAGEGSEYLEVAAPGIYLPCSGVELSSSQIPIVLEDEKQLLEAQEVENVQVDKCVHFKSHHECSSFADTATEIFPDLEYKHAEETEGQSSNISFPEASMLSTMDSYGIHNIVAKLLNEVEELKLSQFEQVQKVNYLEQELAESRLEIQQLKDCCRTLENGLPEGKELKSDNESQATADASICIVGGFNGLSWLYSLDLYSPAQDRMTRLSSMNSVRSYASTTKLNGELYILGGVNGNFWYDTVESYNPLSNQWTIHPPLNSKKGSLAVVSLEDNIFVMGGGNKAECFSEVEIFDPHFGKWISIRSMLHKRFGPAAAEINGILYVAGGYDGNNYLKSVERLDPREGSWTRLESMATKRGCHSLAVLNERLYAVGGYDGLEMAPTPKVEVFDPRFGSWMTVEPMNDPRGYCGAVVIRDALYIFGGLKNDDEILDSVESYKEGRGWRATNWKAMGRRSFFSAVVL